MKHGRRPFRESILLASTLLVIALAVTAAVPPLPAPFLSDRALAGATRIHVVLAPPGREPVDVYGSGWVRSCAFDGRRWRIVVATAGHVVDVAELENEFHTGAHVPVTVEIIWRDGFVLQADRDALRLDRAHDYGVVRLSSPRPRTAIPVGVPGDVRLGAPLYTVASPGAIGFGLFSGHLILRAPIPVLGAPSTSWLTSLAIGPGASGGPVIGPDGRVVATVVGIVSWRWGGTACVAVPIPGKEAL